MIKSQFKKKHIKAALELAYTKGDVEKNHDPLSSSDLLHPPNEGILVKAIEEDIKLILELGEELNTVKQRATNEEWLAFVKGNLNEEVIGLPNDVILAVMGAAKNKYFLENSSDNSFVKHLNRLGLLEVMNILASIEESRVERERYEKKYPIKFQSDEFIEDSRGHKRDAIEETPEYKAVIVSVSKQADEELKTHIRYKDLGYCHVYWPVLQRILREEHGIGWRSPSVMNTGVKFD